VRTDPRPILCENAERADLGGGCSEAQASASNVFGGDAAAAAAAVCGWGRLKESLGGKCLRFVGEIASFDAVE
jgi:hypothetical protein